MKLCTGKSKLVIQRSALAIRLTLSVQLEQVLFGIMISVIYGTVALASLVSKVTAHPSFYDERRMGCEIPSTGFAGHGAPAEDPAVVITVTQDGAPVTSFEAGDIYDIEVPAYSGTANNWIHASAGEMAPADPAAGFPATACPEAAHSGQIPAATHMYIWTAPATTEDVTISAAQATGPSDNYHTATLTLTGGGAGGAAAGAPTGAGAAAGAPTAAGAAAMAPAAAGAAMPTTGGTTTDAGEEEATDTGEEEATDDATTGVTTTEEGEEGTADAAAPADAEEASSGFAAATGTLAAAAAAVAALAM